MSVAGSGPGHVWVNGELLPGDALHLSAFDRSFQLGDGLFETLRARGGHVTELAEHVRLTKQGMMAMVDDLEARGYVRRVPDPNDARAKLVRLTARGRRAAAECRRAMQSVEQRTRRQLGDRRYDTLRETLEELAELELEAEA